MLTAPFYFYISCILTYVAAKHDHPVPTYFGRRLANGQLLDRRSQEYDADIKKPFRTHILRSDADATLKVLQSDIDNGGKATVVWNSVKEPQAKDFIAFYCPAYDNPTHYLDYFYVTQSPTWEAGHGEHTVVVYNMRSTCLFRYYRAGSSYSQLVASSQKISFKGGPEEPLQGHIAMTSNPTEMRVLWTSGEVNQPAVVKYGLTKDLSKSEYEVVVHTYTADSMCRAPANSTGFWHPGYIYDVLLQNLKPNTRYYYSYGTKDHMSRTNNFTTPLKAGDPTPYKFIIYGDMGVDPYPEAVTTAVLVRNELDENDIRFVFHNGDISYARGYAYIWEQWFHLVEPYATLVPYMIGIGNHEQDHTTGGEKDPSHAVGEGGFRPSWFNGGDDSGGECGVPMFKRFHMPNNGNAVWWYSYDYGLVHYIMMSTEHDYSPGSPQYKWLEHNLMNVDRSLTPWVIIGGHRAMYCSEKIDSDYVVSVNMQRLFESLLHKYNVDLAFWAHYHGYERTCKIRDGKCSDDGILHLVVGTAGKSTDADGWYGKDWSVYRLNDYGYGRVTVQNSSALFFEWIQNSSKKVLDSVYLRK